MNRIELLDTLPNVFATNSSIESQVWRQELTFERGKLYLIEANSGGGKSSLCSYIYGARGDYQGVINFDNRAISTFSSDEWMALRQSGLSMLFQDLRLFGELTAMENVELKNQLTHFKKREQIISLFEVLGIGDKLNSRVEHLSFGQQQRVAFIRSLCQPFDFILLDEPISHLDSANGKNVAEILLSEAREQGAGIITTSIGHHLPLPYDLILKL